jgi:MoaA/NifB/PqqE/SkfB family radical SAM enzyme
VNRHPELTSDFEFSAEAIAQAVRHNRLLSMEIEFSLRCNFRCPYCYVPREEQLG